MKTTKTLLSLIGICFAMLTVSGGLCAQSLITYHHYLDYSTEWNEQTIFYGFQDYYYYEMYKLTQDTLINDTAYYKIKEKTNEVGNSSINYTTPYAGALRETEDGKIYYRPNDANTEYLLFDFGTAYQIGDTTNTGCVVAAIDTVYFGNEARRRYETHPPDAPEFSNYLVEGIGIVSENAQVPSGFLNSWGFGYCGQMFDVSSTLLCFRNSQSSYGNCIVSDYFDSILLPPLDTLHLSTNLNQSTNPTTVPLPTSTIISSHSTPQHGLFFWSNFNAHQFIYVPFLDYVGNDEFYFTICNTNDPTDCTNLQVNIIVGDQTANPDLSYTFINTSDTINVLLNDIHTETPLLYLQTPPTHGTIHYAQNEGIYDLSPCDYSGEPAPPIVPTMAGNNAIVYTPNPDFIGVDTFVYVLSRACLGGDTAQVIVHTSNIAPISPVPLYVNYNTPTQPINLGLPASTFINNTPTAPQLGTLTWVDANTFIYTPALDVLGGDEFTLQVCDQNNPNNCIAVTVYVLIANGNANPDISYTLTNTSDTIDVTANDTGAASLIYLQTPPAHGTVHYTHNENVYNVGPCLWSMLPPYGLNTLAGTADVDAIIYTPDPNFVGIDTFVYVSSPGCFGGDTAQVIVHVNLQTLDPIFLYAAFNTPTLPMLYALYPVTTTLFSPPTNGNVLINDNGSFIYTPNLNYSGTDQFYLQLCNPNNVDNCTNLQVNVLVGSQVANPDMSYTLTNTADTIQVLNNDVYTNQPLLYLQTPPAHGTIHYTQNEGEHAITFCYYFGEGNVPVFPVFGGMGAIVYTPNPNFAGVDTFVYVISEPGCVGLDTAQVIVYVQDQYITLADDWVATAPNQAVEINALSNDLVPNNWTLSLVNLPLYGTIEQTPNFTFIYTPSANNNDDVFTYQVCYGNWCDTAQVTVTVWNCEDCTPQVPQQMSTCQDGRWINIPLCPYINNATLTAPNNETVSLINNNYLYINQTGNYTIQYNSTICGAGSTTFNLLIDDDCVFPGDINYDNIANMDDLLDWGLIPMDATGAPRDTATLNWQAQACIDWANTQTNGSNYKHADCNGNGIKDITDPNAITLNYHQTHNGNQAGKTEDEDYTLSAIPIYNPMANNYVDFEIGVQANNNLPLPNIYGIRFDVKYQGDILMVDALFDNYCLGTPNVDMIGLQKYYATDSLLHIGMTRLNLQDVSPNIPLCKVGCLIGTPIIGQIYTTNPNAGSGKTEDYIPVDSISLCLNNVRLLDKNGYETPIGTKIVQIWYDVIPDAAISINNNTNVSVFPNPANQQLNIIYHSLSHPNATFVLYDMLGQQVLSQPITALNTTTLNTSTLPVGVYTYQLWANKNEILQKGKVVVCR